MIEPVPPAAILMGGALLVPVLKGRLKTFYMLFLPVLTYVDLLYMSAGKYWIVRFLDYDLIFGRVDKLSMVFAYVFVLITFIGIIYALHVKDDAQHMAALVYAGAALGVTFAGDLFFTFHLLGDIGHILGFSDSSAQDNGIICGRITVFYVALFRWPLSAGWHHFLCA